MDWKARVSLFSTLLIFSIFPNNCYTREMVGVLLTSSTVLWVVRETGCLPGVLQPPAQLSLLVAQPVVSEEAGDEE